MTRSRTARSTFPPRPRSSARSSRAPAIRPTSTTRRCRRSGVPLGRRAPRDDPRARARGGRHLARTAACCTGGSTSCVRSGSDAAAGTSRRAADLGPILGGSLDEPRVLPGCGFQNPEAANYCARCGAYLRRDEHGETTLSLAPEEIGDEDRAHRRELRAARRSSSAREGAGRRELRAGGPPHADRPLARLPRLPRRRHRLAAARRDRPRGRSPRIRDLGSLNGTFVNRHRIESVGPRRRRRGTDRQVPNDVPPAMSTTTATTARPPRLHTIGAVCERLRGEFPDISISKIRYLEDQGLLRPRRTRGGYRLFSETDVERLATILRLQRDEFLPLRVIRDALEARGAQPTTERRPALARSGRRGRPRRVLRARGDHRRLRATARGVRPRHAPDRGRRAHLPRERRRDRRRVRPPRASRPRRAPSSRVPHGGRTPVGAARAARRRRAPLARPRAPPRGARRPRDARRSRHRARAAPSRPRSPGGLRAMTTDQLKALVRDVPDFPEPGIVFKDLMPLIGNADAFRSTIEQLADWARPRNPDIILGAEARGFIFGGALAYELGCGFVPARKPGKLPWKTVRDDVRARVRDRLARGARRRVRERRAGDRARRRARDRRDGAGEGRPRRAARRRRRRRAVRHRADVPRRPRAARGHRRARADRVLTPRHALDVVRRRQYTLSMGRRRAHGDISAALPDRRDGAACGSRPFARSSGCPGRAPRRSTASSSPAPAAGEHVGARRSRRARLGAARPGRGLTYVNLMTSRPDDLADRAHASSRPRGSAAGSGRGASSATSRTPRDPSPRRPSGCSSRAPAVRSPSAARPAARPR